MAVIPTRWSVFSDNPPAVGGASARAVSHFAQAVAAGGSPAVPPVQPAPVIAAAAHTLA
jgi:hypothetical protein